MKCFLSGPSYWEVLFIAGTVQEGPRHWGQFSAFATITENSATKKMLKNACILSPSSEVLIPPPLLANISISQTAQPNQVTSGRRQVGMAVPSARP
jgi:hypothetical protein